MVLQETIQGVMDGVKDKRVSVEHERVRSNVEKCGREEAEILWKKISQENDSYRRKIMCNIDNSR